MKGASALNSLAAGLKCCSSVTSSHVLRGLRPYWQLCIKLLMCLAQLHYPAHQSDKGRDKALRSAVREIIGKWGFVDMGWQRAEPPFPTLSLDSFCFCIADLTAAEQ